MPMGRSLPSGLSRATRRPAPRRRVAAAESAPLAMRVQTAASSVARSGSSKAAAKMCSSVRPSQPGAEPFGQEWRATVMSVAVNTMGSPVSAVV